MKASYKPDPCSSISNEELVRLVQCCTNSSERDLAWASRLEKLLALEDLESEIQVLREDFEESERINSRRLDDISDMREAIEHALTSCPLCPFCDKVNGSHDVECLANRILDGSI